MQRFDTSAAPQVPTAPEDDAALPAPTPTGQDAPAAAPPAEVATLRVALAKREWLLEALERQRDLVPGLTAIERVSGLSGEAFLERYYAVNRPVILQGEMADWPALTRCLPAWIS